jgi:ribosomal protein L40E
MSSGIGDYFNKLRTQKYSIPLGITLTAVLSLLLMLYTWYICFSFMAIALIMYGIPTYFGLKDKKKLAVVGLVILLFLGVAWGFMMSSSITNFKGETVSSGNLMTNGTVTPSKALEGETYTFTVTVANTALYNNVTVEVANSWTTDPAQTFDMQLTDNTASGMVFTKQVAFDKTGIYQYTFKLWDGVETKATGSGYGPVNANNDQILTSALTSGTILSFLQVGVLFFMLIFLTWWMDRSKVKMQEKLEKVKMKKEAVISKDGKTEEKFVCSECGSDVPLDAKKCPQCGEGFEEGEEKKCPKCGSVIFETDKKCWNCGVELVQGKK